MKPIQPMWTHTCNVSIYFLFNAFMWWAVVHTTRPHGYFNFTYAFILKHYSESDNGDYSSDFEYSHHRVLVPFFDTWFVIILNAMHFKFASQHKSDSHEVLIHLLWYTPARLLQRCKWNCEQRVKWLIKMYYFLGKWGARQDPRPSWCREALPFSMLITSLSTSHTPSLH